MPRHANAGYLLTGRLHIRRIAQFTWTCQSVDSTLHIVCGASTHDNKKSGFTHKLLTKTAYFVQKKPTLSWGSKSTYKEKNDVQLAIVIND